MLFLAGQQGEMNFGVILFYMIAIFAIVYFLLLRPQRKREKERVQMLQNIKKNDRVLTSGGIFGIVISVGKDEVTLKIDETNNVRVRCALHAVTGVIRQGDKKEEESP